VDALIVSIKDQDQLREYLPASGAERVSAEDLRLLERYATRFGPEYCRHGCGACAEACPHGVPIAEVLRTRMYALDYADMELAREDYARLDAGAAACLSCAKQSCLGRCPIGLVIPEQTKQTHRLLGRG
jgi:predicted aldo/keto reductase-like oxidoreductase